jgi:hypothetical protein
MVNALIKPIVYFAQVVFGVCFAHWFLVQIYGTFCAPWKIMGPFITFMSLGSPTCHFINYIQFELGKHYITLWAAGAAATVLYLVNYLKK